MSLRRSLAPRRSWLHRRLSRRAGPGDSAGRGRAHCRSIPSQPFHVADRTAVRAAIPGVSVGPVHHAKHYRQPAVATTNVMMMPAVVPRSSAFDVLSSGGGYMSVTSAGRRGTAGDSCEREPTPEALVTSPAWLPSRPAPLSRGHGRSGCRLAHSVSRVAGRRCACRLKQVAIVRKRGMACSAGRYHVRHTFFTCNPEQEEEATGSRLPAPPPVTAACSSSCDLNTGGAGNQGSTLRQCTPWIDA